MHPQHQIAPPHDMLMLYPLVCTHAPARVESRPPNGLSNPWLLQVMSIFSSGLLPALASTPCATVMEGEFNEIHIEAQ